MTQLIYSADSGRSNRVTLPPVPVPLEVSSRPETAPSARITMLRKVKRRDTKVTPQEMMAILREMKDE